MPSKRLILSFVAAQLVIFGAGTAAQAQGRRSGFGLPWMGEEGTRMRLLAIEKVRESLKLSDEQEPELAKVGMAYRDEMLEFFGLQNLSQEERTKKIAEAQERTKAAWENCERILTDEQVERVKQISRQARGVNALADEDVMLALKLTLDQKKQLEAIRATADEATRALFRTGPKQGQEQEDRAKKVAEIRKEAGESALALLSDEQKKEFEKLQGEKIELPEGALLPPGVGVRRP